MRDYVREERARDYAAGLAWGLGGSGSSGYGSGYSSGSGYVGYSSGYRLLGYGTGSGDAYANTSSDASSTDSDSSRTDAAQETKSDGQQDGAAAEQGDQASNPARWHENRHRLAAAADGDTRRSTGPATRSRRATTPPRST